MERSAQKFRAIFFSALLASTAHATTFGPVPLSGQIDHSQYVVEGRVLSRKAEMERSTGRPHTYYQLAVSKQLKGSRLPAEITLRQPGGEVGDIGYQVAGAAQFSIGEEVVVMARDTQESPSVKDVIGLSSGKYAVESGGKTLRTGLGGLLSRADGSPMTLRDLEAFVDRANRGKLTDADRDVIVRPERHAHTENGETNEQQHIQSGAKDSAPSNVHGGTHGIEPNQANSLQKSPSHPEESSEGHEGGQRWPWIAGIVSVLAGLGLLIYGLIRK